MTIQKSQIAYALTAVTLYGAGHATINREVVAWANPLTDVSAMPTAAVVPPTVRAAAVKPRPILPVPQSSRLTAARVALARGRQLEKAGLPELAQEQFRHATVAAPRSLEAWQMWARSLSRSSHWVEAASAWREVMALLHDSARSSKTTVEFGANNREAKSQFQAARSHLSAFWVAPDVVMLGANSDNPLSGHRSVTVTSQADLRPQPKPALTPHSGQKASGFSLPSPPKAVVAGSQHGAPRNTSGPLPLVSKATGSQAVGAIDPPRHKVLWAASGASRQAAATAPSRPLSSLPLIASRRPASQRTASRPPSQTKVELSRRPWLSLWEQNWAMRPLVTLGASSDNPLSGFHPGGNEAIMEPPADLRLVDATPVPQNQGVHNQGVAVLRPLPKETVEEKPTARAWTFSFYLPTMALDVPSRRAAQPQKGKAEAAPAIKALTVDTAPIMEKP